MTEYKINIARWTKHGGKAMYIHFCRIEAGGDAKHAQEVLAAITNRFGRPEWSIEMTKWETVGQTIPLLAEGESEPLLTDALPHPYRS